MKNIIRKIAIFLLEKVSTFEELKIAEKKYSDPKRIAGGIGYYEYLPEKVKNPKKVFPNSRFIYKEYEKEHDEWFKTHGFKKPYPEASLGVNLTLRQSELNDMNYPTHKSELGKIERVPFSKGDLHTCAGCRKPKVLDSRVEGQQVCRECADKHFSQFKEKNEKT